MTPALFLRGAGTPRLRYTSTAPDADLELFRLAGQASASARRVLRQQLVVRHLGLADSIARRYRGNSADWSDLRQVARLGLVKAVMGFEPDRGTTFAAYAAPTVSGEIKRYLRDHGWLVRPPRPVQELRAEVVVARSTLVQVLGRPPTVTEIAGELDHDRRSVEEAIVCEGGLSAASFDSRTSETDLRALSETLGATDPNLERAEERAALASVLRELTEWERTLLYLRYFEDCTQQQIAERLNISQMQVSRVLNRLLARLRDLLGS